VIGKYFLWDNKEGWTNSSQLDFKRKDEKIPFKGWVAGWHVMIKREGKILLVGKDEMEKAGVRRRDGKILIVEWKGAIGKYL